jgi:hypothetical protein
MRVKPSNFIHLVLITKSDLSYKEIENEDK